MRLLGEDRNEWITTVYKGVVFTQVIEKYYKGFRDVKTLKILKQEENYESE